MTLSATPWWETLKLRSEVRISSGAIDDVQMSLFRAVHSLEGDAPPYAAADYYGEITYPTPPLVELMAKVAVRLGGGSSYTAAPALWRLDQSMGGGKSHGLIGLYHLAAHPKQLRLTDVGAMVFAEATDIVGHELPTDLNKPQVVVLACDNMTAGRGNPDIDGIATTLHERFLWRLFGGDVALYKRYQPHYADKSKLADAMTAVGRPVLILVDEVLDYVRQLSDSANADLAVKDMAFLRALLDAINDVAYVAMVIVMIASEHDAIALDAAGLQRRAELDDLLIRNGRTATVTANTDFAAILRRRLFVGSAPSEVVQATTASFATVSAGIWTDKVFSLLPASSARSFGEEVARCYPFNPALMAMAEQEWAKLAGFQKVRSTIQIFAATAYSLNERAARGDWVPRLIGVGDLPLSNALVREAIIGSGLIADSKTQANYRQIASTDIVSVDDEGGAARVLDQRRSGLFKVTNPRPAERAATALFLCSIVGTRGQGRQGATEIELKASTFVPDTSFGLADADAVIAELKDVEAGGLASLESIAGKTGHPARMFLSTRKTLNMLFNSTRASVADVDRDSELAAVTERLTTEGPFRQKLFVSARALDEDPRSSVAAIESTGIDNARITRLVVLDPRRFSLMNGSNDDSRDAIRSAMGLGSDKLPVLWASSAVFAVINSSRRPNARGTVTTYLAWLRVSEMDEVRSDPELSEKAADERADAKRNMETAIRRAYQHIVYLAASEDDRRVEKIRTFEHENQSALNGVSVWKELVNAAKAFDVGAFGAQALMHNLTDSDFERPLDEIRDLFWNSPRLPLLPNAESDLKRAIFDAINSGKLVLVGSDGIERQVSTPDEIGVGQASLHLKKVQPNNGSDKLTAEEIKMAAVIGTVDSPRIAIDGFTGAAKSESDLSFTIMASLTSEDQRFGVFQLLRAVAQAIDDGSVSYGKVSVSLIIEREAASKVEAFAKAANTTVTLKQR